jgi:hypothetical protein
MKYILIVIAILGISMFSGCVPQSTYETLQKENKSLKIENEQLQLNNTYCETWFNDYRLEKADNPFAKDVSFSELVSFLQEDSTWEHEYILGKYVCVHFATDLHNNAEVKSIRACIVLSEDRSHAFNAFHTTDRGLFFVDESDGSKNIYQWNKSDYYEGFHYFW